jgi:hypothetical protein
LSINDVEIEYFYDFANFSKFDENIKKKKKKLITPQLNDVIHHFEHYLHVFLVVILVIVHRSKFVTFVLRKKQIRHNLIL